MPLPSPDTDTLTRPPDEDIAAEVRALPVDEDDEPIDYAALYRFAGLPMPAQGVS